MKRTVLVVDDTDDVRVILGHRLTKAGFEVTTANDGAEGLAALHQQAPCCVLLDLMMPRMNGFEFLAALRRHHPAPPPVFVVTQLDDHDTRQRVRDLGAEKLFTKTEAFHRDFPAALEHLLAAALVHAASTSGAVPAAA